MGALHALGLVAGALELVVLAVEVGGLLAEQADQHRTRFLEPIEPFPKAAQLDAIGARLLLIPAGADPQLESSVRDDVERGGHVGQQGGVAVVDPGDQGAQSQPLGGLRQRGESCRGETTTTSLEGHTNHGTTQSTADPCELSSKRSGGSLKDLTVLAPQNDPYRVDTPAGHRDGAWLADTLARLGACTGQRHLRGLHYILIGGRSEAEWLAIHQHRGRLAVAGARPPRPPAGCGYVPFDRIVDQRNDEPVIRRLDPAGAAARS